MEVLWLTEALLVAWQKAWWLLKQEKQSSMLCLTEAVLSQLLVLKFCSMLIPSFVMIDESQPDKWHSILQSAKAVLVTPFWDLGYLKVWMRWVFQSLTVEQKTQKKVIYLELLACFEPGRVQQMKPGSIILDWGQTHNPWNGTILILPGQKNWKSLCHRVMSWSLSSGTVKVRFLWMRCFSGRHSTPMHTSGH